jgi:DnaJ like chaperone protein
MHSRYDEIIDKYGILMKESIYTAPNIPTKKLLSAIKSYANRVDPDRVLLMCDDTVFGSAKEGIIITPEFFYSHSFLEKPQIIRITSIKDISIKSGFVNHSILINGTVVFVGTQADKKSLQALVLFVSELSNIARAADSSHNEAVETASTARAEEAARAEKAARAEEAARAEKAARAEEAAERDEKKSLFCLFSLLAKAASLNGKINKNKIEFAYLIIDEVCNQLPNATDMENMAKSAFNKAIKNDTDPSAYLEFISHNAKDEDALIEIFFMLLNLCGSDGRINIDEQVFLLNCCRSFSLDIEGCKEAINDFNDDNYGATNNESHNKSEYNRDNDDELGGAFSIIGCNYSSSESEIKGLYRKKISEFHPDKIQGKGLSQAFIEFANEQAKIINNAYEIIMTNFKNSL